MVVFIVWIAFIPLEQKKLESHQILCENKDFRYIKMPSKDTKILEFSQYQKSGKSPFINLSKS